MGNQGKPVVGIPRWLTTANLLGIVLAFTLAIPFGARASHQGGPTNLVVSRISSPNGYAPTALKLTWQDPGSATTTKYQLQRARDAAFSQSVVSWVIARNTFEFWDETFTASAVTFYYRVWSYVGEDRSSTPSNRVSATNNTGTVPPSTPAAPTFPATENAGQGVRISWQDNSSTETFFRIERGTAEAQSQNLTWEWRGNAPYKAGSGTRTSWVDSDGVTGSYYRITAFNPKACDTSRPESNTCARSNAIGYTAVGVPNVVPSSIGIPSDLTSATAIASPFVSMATGISSALNPAGLQSSVNNIVSPLAGATSLIPAPSGVASTVNAVASNASAIASNLIAATGAASPFVSSAQSVLANPTGLLPNLNNYGLFIGMRINNPGFPPQPFGPQIWLLPASCINNPSCPPPANPTACNPIIPPFEYCYYIDTDPTS